MDNMYNLIINITYNKKLERFIVGMEKDSFVVIKCILGGITANFNLLYYKYNV